MKKIILFLFLIYSTMLANKIEFIKLTSNELKGIPTYKKTQIAKRLEKINRLLISLKKIKSQKVILNRINYFFNKYSYKKDILNYKKLDYWALPREFIIRGSGDCEDYAISKYFLLKYLGFRDKEFIFIQGLYKNKNHLVLSVNGLILDNTTNKLFSLKKKKNFKVLYKINPAKLSTHTTNKLFTIKLKELFKRLEKIHL